MMIRPYFYPTPLLLSVEAEFFEHGVLVATE